jgi:hypothetical protein
MRMRVAQSTPQSDDRSSPPTGRRSVQRVAFQKRPQQLEKHPAECHNRRQPYNGSEATAGDNHDLAAWKGRLLQTLVVRGRHHVPRRQREPDAPDWNGDATEPPSSTGAAPAFGRQSWIGQGLGPRRGTSLGRCKHQQSTLRELRNRGDWLSAAKHTCPEASAWHRPPDGTSHWSRSGANPPTGSLQAPAIKSPPASGHGLSRRVASW